MNQDETKSRQETGAGGYTDLLLLDIFHPDWKHFFSRYKVDIIGFLGAWLFVAFIFAITIVLARIGS